MKGEVRCLVCGKGYLKPAKVEEKMYGISLGTYEGGVCEECGETFLKGSEMDRAETQARELGLWGLEKKVKVGKSVNSLIVRIPSRIADFLNLQPGREVFLSPRERTASWWKPKRVAAARRKLDQGIRPAQNDRLGSLGCNGICAHRGDRSGRVNPAMFSRQPDWVGVFAQETGYESLNFGG